MKRILQRITKPIGLLFIGLGLAITFFVASYHQPRFQLIIEKQVQIEKGLIPDPNTIVRTADKGFIIAGKIESLHQAWATKTDAEGNVLWRYTKSNIEQTPPKFIDGAPNYYGAAIGPDDGVYLCGSMWRPLPGNSLPALLTHLDKNGKVLFEKIMQPAGDADVSISKFNSCALWNGNIVLVGSNTIFLKDPNGSPSSMVEYHYYWIVGINLEGNVQWEKLIPISDKMPQGSFAVSPIQQMPDGGFIFVAQGLGESEIIQIGSDGNLKNRKFVNGLKTLVRSSYGSPIIQVISSEGSSLESASASEVITLNNNLEVIESQSRQVEFAHTRDVLRLPDGFLLLYGSRLVDSYESAYVFVLNPSMHIEQAAGLEGLGRSYWAVAAVPLESSQQFVSVRSVFKHSKYNEPISNHNDEDGVIMDFVHVEPK